MKATRWLSREILVEKETTGRTVVLQKEAGLIVDRPVDTRPKAGKRQVTYIELLGGGLNGADT